MPGGRRAMLAVTAALGALTVGATPVAAGGAVVYRYGDQAEKVVALTFDDGYFANRTEQVVAILDRYQASATFFPYANAVLEAPALWRSIADRYPIANHTVTHPNLKRLTASQVYGEIDGARRIVESVINRPMVPIFRPPYGAYNTSVLTQAYAAGFTQVAMWSVDSGDGLGLADQQVYARAISGGNGAIVLMHAGPAVTVRVLPRVIESYRARGYRLVTLPEMLGVGWDGKPIAAAAQTLLPAPHDTPTTAVVRAPVRRSAHRAYMYI
ncbi:MAG: polysaccharide deacetylase family protein [Chloroflexota bacterium]|nr:polysaccharide deacetylase family protein [Chloroflexota bacterium]